MDVTKNSAYHISYNALPSEICNYSNPKYIVINAHMFVWSSFYLAGMHFHNWYYAVTIIFCNYDENLDELLFLSQGND